MPSKPDIGAIVKVSKTDDEWRECMYGSASTAKFTAPAPRGPARPPATSESAGAPRGSALA